MEKRKILIDTDPGIDDAFALSAAMLCDSLELLGITTVAGNKPLSAVTANALRLVDFFKREIPVAEGAWAPLNKMEEKNDPDSGAKCHGSDGMGESGLPFSNRCLIKTPAWDFILEKIHENPGQIELIALGPLTNLAMAVKKDAAAMKQLKSITIMGGSFLSQGNITAFSEYNIWFDAEAADWVVRALGKEVEICFVGLDCTMNCVFSHDEIAFLEYEGEETGALLAKIVRTYMQAYYRGSGILGAVIHDLYAMMVLIDQKICLEKLNTGCHVVTAGQKRGQTAPDLQANPVSAVIRLDEKRLKREFFELLLPGKKEAIQRIFPELY